MRKFYADYAIYNGITYLSVDYRDKVELFAWDDIDHKNMLYSLPLEAVEDRYSEVYYAVLNGIQYVFYEIKDNVVTYGTTHANAQYRYNRIEEFDLIYKIINYKNGKPTERKIIYINETKESKESVNLRFRPEEMANGSIMFSVLSDIVSANDVYKCLEKLYEGRLSNRGGISSTLALDEFVSWVDIDGIRINIDQDLCWDITTVFPKQKGSGENYIFEIIDYFNKIKVQK